MSMCIVVGPNGIQLLMDPNVTNDSDESNVVKEFQLYNFQSYIIQGTVPEASIGQFFSNPLYGFTFGLQLFTLPNKRRTYFEFCLVVIELLVEPEASSCLFMFFINIVI